ncbi:MAG: methyltransferase domain-containing protein [Phycisphaeraceae bacterium]|nr:methyltransferase domain-containing protein [Phycisphaeraceae bacterium]
MPTESQNPPETYLAPYRQWASRYGTDFGVTLWASPRSQQRRFEVIAEMCFLTGKRILDAGCSRGDLADFLLHRGVMFDQYIGIDALPPVIDHAKSRALPRCRFHVADLLNHPGVMAKHRPQIVAISGTLNTMTDDQVFRLLDAAWNAATEVLVFNFLSDRCGPGAPPQDDYARRIDTLALLQWSFDRTWCVVFRQDYFEEGHDATILMRKRG